MVVEVVEVSLHGEQNQEGHHQAEQSHGLGESEAQNGVGEELLFEGGVPGVSDDETAEHRSDPGSRSSHAHGGGSGANELGRRVDVPAGGASLQGATQDHGLTDWKQRL